MYLDGKTTAIETTIETKVPQIENEVCSAENKTLQGKQGSKIRAEDPVTAPAINIETTTIIKVSEMKTIQTQAETIDQQMKTIRKMTNTDNIVSVIHLTIATQAHTH